MQLVSFCGIRISISPYLILIGLIAVFLDIGIQVVAMFLAVLGHELCHTLVAKMLGVIIDEIELLPFGGAAHYRDQKNMLGIRETIIALMGPMFNVACAVVMLLVMPMMKAVPAFWPILIRFQITMAVFNLLPAYPLDGGRMLRGILTCIIGIRRATKVVTVFGVAVGGATVIISGLEIIKSGCINLPLLLVGCAIWAAAWQERFRYDTFSALLMMERKKNKILHRGGMKEYTMTVFEDNTVRQALQMIQKKSFLRLHVVDKQYKTVGYINEGQLKTACMENKIDQTLREILCNG